LLWPKDNQWPPEVDFNETPSAHQTIATVHWSYANYIQQWIKNGINMESWHTWGVIWTKSELIYTLDGRLWGIITNKNEIPTIAMSLDLEQRTECGIHAQCPKKPVQMQVDWIAEYHQR
jgi:beta-glucanase (GH16 family)